MLVKKSFYTTTNALEPEFFGLQFVYRNPYGFVHIIVRDYNGGVCDLATVEHVDGGNCHAAVMVGVGKGK